MLSIVLSFSQLRFLNSNGIAFADLKLASNLAEIIQVIKERRPFSESNRYFFIERFFSFNLSPVILYNDLKSSVACSSLLFFFF